MEKLGLEKLIEQTSLKLNEPVDSIISLHLWKKQMYHLIDKIAELKLPLFRPTVNDTEESLDPVDWASARFVAHQTLDLSIDYLELVRNRPVWQVIPAHVRAAIEDEPVPEHGQPLKNVCEDSFAYIVPYALGNTHPRFWGWVTGEGTLGGVLADMIAATINVNNVGGMVSSVIVEETVIKWMRQIFGFPPANFGGGILVGGTSLATVICLAVARQCVIENVRKHGLVNGSQLIVYASTEVHTCVVKGLELLGLGSQALRLVPVDDNFRIKISELEVAIHNDREKGLVPCCIVGNAGI
jgi:aromatic-L-amino-acid/L-tryptophan decarboxylase